jgi:hypothetical protein
MAHGRGVWDEGVQVILRSFLNAVRLFLCVMYLSPKAIQTHFGVMKEVAVELVDTLGQGVDTGHGKGPWDDIGGAAKRMISQDFVENQRCMQQDYVENQQ